MKQLLSIIFFLSFSLVILQAYGCGKKQPATNDGDTDITVDGDIDNIDNGDIADDDQPAKGARIEVENKVLYFLFENTNSSIKAELFIKNTGNEDLNISRIELREGNNISTNFAISPDNDQLPPFNMHPNTRYSVSLQFTPENLIYTGGVCIIKSNDPDTPELEIKLAAIPDLQTCIYTSPKELNFGEVSISNNKEYATVNNLILNNNCEATVFVDTVEIIDDGGNENFIIPPGYLPPLPFTLEPGKKMTTRVKYTPKFADNKTTYDSRLIYSYKDDAGNPGGLSVKLHGKTKDAPSDTCIKVEPFEGIYNYSSREKKSGLGIDFGTVEINTNQTRNLKITNCGELTVLITNMEVTAEANTFCTNIGGCDFSIAGGDIQYPVEIAPGSFSEFAVNFNPVKIGEQAVSMWISTNAGEISPQPLDNVSTSEHFLYGVYGNAGTKQLNVIPDNLKMYAVAPGCCSEVENKLELWNGGSIDLVVDDIALSDSSLEGFSFAQLPDMPYKLSANSKLDITLQFCAPEDAETGATFSTQVYIKVADDTFEIPVEAIIDPDNHRTDNFVQPSRPKPDLLVVIDGSIGDTVKTKLIQSFENNLNTLKKSWEDYNIAFIDNDLKPEPLSNLGKFVYDSIPVIKSLMSDDSVKNAFRKNIAKLMEMDIITERAGLNAALKALTPPLSTDDNEPNSKFIREDAILEIIQISEQKELSGRNATTYSRLFRSIKNLRRVDMVKVHAIVKPDNNNKYMIVADALGGTFQHINDLNYEQVFGAIKPQDKQRYLYPLSRMPDTSTIKVTADGRLITNWCYDETVNSVEVPKQYGSDSVNIVIEYDVPCNKQER